jgi:predicted small metal-binding protein
MSEKPFVCPHCTSSFRNGNGLYSHVRMKHGKAKAREINHLRKSFDSPGAARDEEESMASIFIQAEINRNMGISNEDWIEDMLP